ncbi:MAG: helix-turn-helix domain-containing protein [Rhodospirillales bacterium]|nr:MAG: helix-turn-helix domain-containing protein [Rhodospirillales bacterium]
MALLDMERTQDAPPTLTEMDAARTSSQQLAHYVNERVRISLSVARGDNVEVLDLPLTILRPMIEILAAVARGEPAQVLPMKAQLTTQEAADLLHVSRPYLIKLLEEGKIKFTKVGTHRRIEFSALLGYKRERDQTRESALDELAAIAQQNGMGY